MMMNHSRRSSFLSDFRFAEQGGQMRIYGREILAFEVVCDCGATYSEHSEEDGELLCPMEGKQIFLPNATWLENQDIN